MRAPLQHLPGSSIAELRVARELATQPGGPTRYCWLTLGLLRPMVRLRTIYAIPHTWAPRRNCIIISLLVCVCTIYGHLHSWWLYVIWSPFRVLAMVNALYLRNKRTMKLFPRTISYNNTSTMYMKLSKMRLIQSLRYAGGERLKFPNLAPMADVPDFPGGPLRWRLLAQLSRGGFGKLLLFSL